MIDNSELIVLSLGTNIGDRIESLNNAVALLIDSGTIENARISSYYETEPYGVKDQPGFINISIIADTQLSAFALLNICKSIEYLLGRKIRNRWTEREIDIDIIFYGQNVIDTELLKIPHIEVEKRNFVLVPTCEIAPDYINPRNLKSVREMIDNCADSGEVKLIIKSTN